MAAESAQAILQSRARALAQPPTPDAADAGTLAVLEFELARERFAIEQTCVQELRPLEALTPLPCVPGHIAGVSNIRGRILPMIDLTRFFQINAVKLPDLHMVIVVRSGDLEVGVLADRVIGLATIHLADLTPGLPTLNGIGRHYLKGITPRHVAVLDLARILADPRMLVDERIADDLDGTIEELDT